MTALRWGYVTNGLTDHRLDDALRLLADYGYDGVALTLDHHHLDPFGAGVATTVTELAGLLAQLNLAVTIETGARFLLDPRRKHEPTLLSDEGRERRVDLLRRAVVIAADLGANAVSCWSGTRPDDVSVGVAWDRLVDGVEVVLAMADDRGVALGFEPEPGMLVERLDGWDRLAASVGHHPRFGVTLDLGHCHCIEDEPVDACVRRVAERLVHVHVEDMRRGVHEHLDFGEGGVDFVGALGALADVEYRGLVSVELSRHSHAAHIAVPRAIEYLRAHEREAAA